MKHRSMMMALCAVSVLAACGGGAEGGAPPKSARAAAAEGDPNLGHFASLDGMVHMTIDRVGTKAKMQLDGEKEIVELTSEEVRERGDLIGHSFRAPDGRPVLFVSVNGAMSYVRGRDELPLRRDGDAARLGRPTIAGTPPAPPITKGRGELALERFEKIAVTKRTKLTPADAANLKRVAEAFETADKDMFVHFVPGARSTARYHPTQNQTFTTSKVDAGPLGKFGGRLLHIIDVERDTLKTWGLQLGAADPPALAEGTPGLVWDADTSRVHFVTMDGGSYEIAYEEGGSDLARGVEGTLAKWPAPLQVSALGPGEVHALAESGAIAKDLADPVDKGHEAWRTCVEGTFGGLKKELKRLDAENIQWSAREARKKEAREQWSARAETECSAHEKKLEALLVTFVEGRNKDRLALAEKAKARAVALGIAK